MNEHREVTRDARAAGAILFGLAALLISGALLSEQLGFGVGAGEQATQRRQTAMVVAGLAGACLGLALLALTVACRFAPHTRSEALLQALVRPSDRQLTGLGLALLALLFFVLMWTRLLNLEVSFWHDEAHTVLNFSSQGPGSIVLWDSFHFNNHALYNLLSWASVSALGETESVYRLWSVVPGVLAIALATWWIWTRIGRLSSVVFSAIAVSAPAHLEYVPQARGYGLALLAATLILILADRLTIAYSRRTLAGFVAAGLMGIWTLLIFAIAYAGQCLSLARSRSLRVPALLALVSAGALSALLYAPVLGGIVGAGVSGETIPLTAALLLDRPLEWFVIPSFTFVTGEAGRPALDGAGVAPDAPWATWVDVLALGLLITGVITLCRRGSVGLALILVAPPLFFNVFLSVDGQTTTVRHQVFLLPYVTTLVALGAAQLGKSLFRLRPIRPTLVIAGSMLVVALSAAIIDQQQQRTLPRENFKQAAQIVNGLDGERVVTDSNRATGFEYYLGDRLEVLEATDVERLACGDHGAFVYLRHVPTPEHSWSDWRPASLDCFTARGATRLRVPQRSRGGAIDVWLADIVTGPAGVAEDLPVSRPER